MPQGGLYADLNLLRKGADTVHDSSEIASYRQSGLADVTIPENLAGDFDFAKEFNDHVIRHHENQVEVAQANATQLGECRDNLHYLADMLQLGEEQAQERIAKAFAAFHDIPEGGEG